MDSPTQNPKKADLSFNEARQLVISRSLWNLGDICYKLKPCQQQMHLDIEASPGFKYVIKCSRRIGKSFYLVSRGTMRCLRQRGAMVRYAAPTQKSLKTIIQPIMRQIIEDCPDNLRPRYSASEGAYVVDKMESMMYMSGLNAGHAENHRGNKCDEFIIDEAGIVDDLDYVVKDIAMPQLLDMDKKVIVGRKIIISGTPPRTPAHEFTRIARQAQAAGNYSHFTIYDGGFSPEVIEEFCREAGGPEASTWKREYLAEDVVDEAMALCPEWRGEYVQEPLRDEYFQFYHTYESLDIGVRDLSVCLFAHYDFRLAKLFVHDEVVMNGPSMTTLRLAEAVKTTESQLFGARPLYKRISDKDLLLLNDLRALHGLYFNPTDKGYLEEMVNEVRIWVGSGRLIVSPRCKQLIGCLGYGVWNERRDDLDRVPEYGHFDAFAALMYLIRNIDQKTNPIPHDYNKPKEDWWYPEENPAHKNRDKLKKAFNLR